MILSNRFLPEGWLGIFIRSSQTSSRTCSTAHFTLASPNCGSLSALISIASAAQAAGPRICFAWLPSVKGCVYADAADRLVARAAADAARWYQMAPIVTCKARAAMIAMGSIYKRMLMMVTIRLLYTQLTSEIIEIFYVNGKRSMFNRAVDSLLKIEVTLTLRQGTGKRGHPIN